MTVIPDASVILKWVLPRNISPFQDEALTIRDAAISEKISLIVPPLWRYEVGNTLTRLVPDNALQLIKLCESVGLTEVVADDAWLDTAVDLARQSNISSYVCLLQDWP